jgi:uncharacterized protein
MSKRALAAFGAAVLAAVLFLAAPASAHVTIQPGTATKGSFATFAVQVPNERDDAATNRVELVFPEGQPIEHVSVQPVAGWTVDTETTPVEGAADGEATEVVSRVIWSGGTIEPGRFQQFLVSAGPLPDDVDQLVFPAIQTYDSGEEVRWIQETAEGEEEPVRPAPVLVLADAAAGDGDGDSHGSATDVVDADETGGIDNATEVAADDDDSNGLAIAGLVVAVVALLLGAAALLRSRSSATTSS